MIESAELGHEWLGRLTREVSEAACRSELAVTLGQALVRDLGATAVELTLPPPDEAEAPISLVWRALDGLIEGVPRTQSTRAGELSVRRAGRQWDVRIPVPVGAALRGELSILFAGERGMPPIAAQTDRLLAVGCIVGMACHGCDSVAKLERRLPPPGGEPKVVAGGAVREALEQVEHSTRQLRALIVSTGPALQLPELAQRAPSKKVASRTLSDAVRAAIIDALQRTGGKLYGKDGAAAALGMKPSTLQSKMRKLGVERAPYVK